MINIELPIMKWTEVFDGYMSRKIWIRTIPLIYVITVIVDLIQPAPDIKADNPHGKKYLFIEEDLIARESHSHSLYREDNAKVYFSLEEASRGTQYSSSIKLFQKKKDGQEAMDSIKWQFSGVDKWQTNLCLKDEFLHSAVWKGQMLFPLE
eukprot:4216354-Ditylum_brightwellii.AAC.1